MFTPMTRRALSAAQQEQERLGHAAVEPAHLLLALLKVRLEVGDWGHFFLVIFVSFYIFYVDVFFLMVWIESGVLFHGYSRVA
jgi:hypothetical protein